MTQAAFATDCITAWLESFGNDKTACVPHTPYILILRLRRLQVGCVA